MPLNGLVVPIVTLFGDQGKLDLTRNTRFVRGLIDDGVHHLLSLGVPGEPSSLSETEREQLLEKVVESCTFGTDVWAGIDGVTTEEAVARADTAEAVGASVLVAFPPHGARVEPSHVLERFRAIHSSSKLSLVAYRVPGQGGELLSPAVVHTLAKEGVLEGVIDASGDLTSPFQLLESAPAGFTVFGGDGDDSVEALEKGALGVAWETGNILPRLSSKIWELWERHETEKLRTLLPLERLLLDASRAAPRPASIKFLAHDLREADEGYRAPHGALTEEQRAKVLAMVEPRKAELQEYA
ncbi:MAG: dihydrodipicolinate synthase family protein [Euryarchaeota archaeon]|nr:dihydrodipicolinate synthase family protein [Euryarchaeota archaeon]MDE2044009.1 dihydrodipicolinate synthase family protein [Thermoplasmata archaeon]